MESFKNYAIAAIAICAIAICGASQNALTKNKAVPFFTRLQDTLSAEQFIKQLSTASAKEINLSKLARKKSKHAEVREYAVKAMDACILIYADMRPFAEARNVMMVDSMMYVPNQLIAALKKAGSANFDRQYLSISIEDHNQAIALLEKATMFGDTAIVSFANRQLAVFRRNLEEAKYLSKNFSSYKMMADKPREKN